MEQKWNDGCEIWHEIQKWQKTITTVQGVIDDSNKRKPVKAFKKKFACSGTAIRDPG